LGVGAIAWGWWLGRQDAWQLTGRSAQRGVKGHKPLFFYAALREAA